MHASSSRHSSRVTSSDAMVARCSTVTVQSGPVLLRHQAAARFSTARRVAASAVDPAACHLANRRDVVTRCPDPQSEGRSEASAA